MGPVGRVVRRDAQSVEGSDINPGHVQVTYREPERLLVWGRKENPLYKWNNFT
jgi:hypothetical protein